MGYPGIDADYAARLPGSCVGVHGCRVMLHTIDTIMRNYETLEAEGREFYESR